VPRQPIHPTPEPAPTRSRLPAAQRRELLLDAARAEFVRRGYAGAKTKDIAEATGVTEAMLYRFFDSKQQLFEAAVTEPLEKAVASVLAFQTSRTPRPAGTDGTRLVKEQSVEFFVSLLVAMREIAPLLGIVLFSDEQEGSRYYRERIAPNYQRLRDVVTENLPTWDGRDFDPDILVRITLGMCWILAVDERFTPDAEYRPDEVARELVELVFDGIRARR
jgi:TetR/AcrR family transcriptional regulator